MSKASTDIDDVRRVWTRLEAQLERQHALAFEQFKEARVRRLQSGLRPIYWGQALQIVFGVACIALGVKVWPTYWEVWHLCAAGLVLHVYGVVAIVCAVRTLDLVARLDPAAPVVTIQARLAEVRQWWITSGLLVGLPWWFLWMPAAMALVALLGVDVFARAPLFFAQGAAVGVVGTASTVAAHVLSQRPGWPRLAKFMEDSVVLASLRRAQAALDEVQRFAVDAVDASEDDRAGRD